MCQHILKVQNHSQHSRVSTVEHYNNIDIVIIHTERYDKSYSCEKISNPRPYL